MANTTLPPEPWIPPATWTSIEQFMNGAAAAGPNFIEELARQFKQSETFKAITTNHDAGYWVGIRAYQTGIRFSNLQMTAGDQRINDHGNPRPFAVIVPVIGGEVMVSTKILKRDSVKFREGQYITLDLNTNPRPRFVLTTQLTGCTFAIGSVGNVVYMGHAQPKSDSTLKVINKGKRLAETLSKGPIFRGLPRTLESKFFIDARDVVRPDEEDTHLGYVEEANVLGLVHGGKLFFIVTEVKSDVVEKVFVVSQEEGSREWTHTEVT